MSITHLFESGVFPDIAAHSGLFYLVARLGDPRVAGHVGLFTWEGDRVEQIREIARLPVRKESPGFPRIAFERDELWVAYHDGQIGILRNVTTSETLGLNPCHNNDPICFGSGYVAWQGAADERWPITRMRLSDRTKERAGFGAGTGLSRVLPDGVVRLVDDDRLAVSGGTRPAWSGELVVVEDSGDRGARGLLADGREALIWSDVQIVTPRCAHETSLGLFGVVGWSASDGRLRAAVLRDDDFTARSFLQPAPINRALWVGWFEFGKPPQTPPGNCILALTPAAAQVNLPTILGNITTSAGPVIAQYIQGRSVEEIETQAAQAGRPVVAYWDNDRQWPRLPNLPPGSWTCVKGYRLKDESLPAFELDLRRIIRTMSDRQVAVVCQCYTSNTAHTTDLKSLVPVYGRLAELHENVTMLLAFSDHGRATGLSDHPEVRPLWQTLSNSVLQPPITTTTMPAQPRFTIAEPTFPITAQITPGGVFTFRAVAQLEPGAGEPDWIEWRYSKTGAQGPWTVAVRNPGFDKDHTFKVDKAGTFWFGATAGNAAGTHHTGAERKVTVTEGATLPTPQPQPQPTPQPTPQPQPEPGEGQAIGTHDGTHFLHVGADGVLDAKADTESATKILIAKDGDHVTLFVPSIQRYIHAVNGGGGKAIANKTAVGAHEQWRLIRSSAGFSLQSQNGPFLCAEGGGGSDVNVNRPDAGPWETLTGRVAAGPIVARRTGRVRADNRCFADDGGPFNALSCSLFYGLSAYRDRRDVFDANCQFLAEHGFHAFRVMSELGPPLFSDRVADPGAADYDASLTGMIDYAYDVFGLRTQLVIFGGTDYNVSMPQREAHVDRIARLLNDRTDRIHFVEIINEGWQTFHGGSLAAIKQLAQRFRSSSDLLLATTDSPDWDTGHEQTYGGSVANVSTVHLPRDQFEEGWRAVRQPWEARGQFDPSLMANDEPVGPESSVAQDRDPTRLVLSAIMTYLSGLSQYTLHTGAGVTGGNGQDSHARTTVNVFDYPEVRTAAEGYRAMQAYLPPDFPNWTKRRWDHQGHPFKGSLTDLHWPSLPHLTHGVAGDYAATKDGQFVHIVYGVRQYYDVKPDGGRDFDVIHPLTGEVVQHVTLNAGQSHRLEGLTAYVLKGQFV